MSPQRLRRSAFTPVELVALVFVTLTIAALSYSAYRTQRVRGQVIEGISLARAIAPLVAETIRQNDGISPELAAAIPVAFQEVLVASVVESIAVVDGRIDVVFSGYADSAIAGLRVSLTPYETADRGVVWVCGNDRPGPGLNALGFTGGGPQPVPLPSRIEPRHLPADCR